MRSNLTPVLLTFLSALTLAFAMSASACVEIDGGAVEVSWVVRTPSGAGITDFGCADPAIATVRLVLRGVGGTIDGATPCAGRAQCDFPCQRQTGATPFDIRETLAGERYEVSVVAVANGVELPQVTSPAPILREVVRAQPTQVEAFQLVAACAAGCGMNSSGVCARP
jgi:hypothetical protein